MNVRSIEVALRRVSDEPWVLLAPVNALLLAVGWVAVGSNIIPAEFANMFTLCIEDFDLIAARRPHGRILSMIEPVSGHRYVSATKTAPAAIGFAVGSPRPLRLPSPQAERDRAEQVVGELEFSS
ncbi:MAG: dihydrodipicolinate synthase family protein [Gammaproteobacteria bacterium]